MAKWIGGVLGAGVVAVVAAWAVFYLGPPKEPDGGSVSTLPALNPTEVAELQVYLTRCSDGVGEACNSAAVRIGDGKGAPVDFEKSAELYLRACELGSGRGCRNYGRRLKLGKGVEIDLEAAKSYYVRACELNYAKACQELASL